MSKAKAWHSLTFVLIAAAILTQLVLTIQGSGVQLAPDGSIAGTGERVLRFFSFFTIQSNLLAAGTALALILRPDRDGRTWRVLRVSAILGMTVTFITYMAVLRPIVHVQGISKLTDIAFHYIAPPLTVIGWYLFGPWPRIDVTTLLRHLAWPFLYFSYTLVLGASTGWYPYPFIDAGKLGYPHVLRNALALTLMLLILGAIYHVLDTRLGKAKAQPPR
ncbi:MAG: Pr6Pr family membrane protein [Gemmatimonadota bacterium]